MPAHWARLDAERDDTRKMQLSWIALTAKTSKRRESAPNPPSSGIARLQPAGARQQEMELLRGASPRAPVSQHVCSLLARGNGAGGDALEIMSY
jgi:hypothetical protein